MIIITGGLGFIGNELVRQLKNAGEKIAILDNRNRMAPHIDDIADVPVYEVDIADKEKVLALFEEIKPTTVYHLAAIHYIPECNNDPERTLRVNVEGTESILNAAAKVGVSTFIYISSGAVYADSTDLLTESSPVAPVDIYGWSKWFGEQLCHLNNTSYGTPIIICRLFNNYGPRETNMHIIPEVINQIKSGDTLKLGNITTIRDYIHTGDCAKSLIKLAGSCKEGVGIVNVAHGCGYTVLEMIHKIQSITGRVFTIETDNTRIRKVDKQSQVADIGLLKKITGWQPEIDIQEGLSDLLKFEKVIV